MGSNGVLKSFEMSDTQLGSTSSASEKAKGDFTSDGSYHQDQHEVGTVKIVMDEEKELSRALKQRHIQMIALAGAIGTGLFLSLGSALQTGGPVGALLGYAFVGLIVCFMQFALGEVCSTHVAILAHHSNHIRFPPSSRRPERLFVMLSFSLTQLLVLPWVGQSSTRPSLESPLRFLLPSS
jgi:hypothetical protein